MAADDPVQSYSSAADSEVGGPRRSKEAIADAEIQKEEAPAEANFGSSGPLTRAATAAVRPNLVDKVEDILAHLDAAQTAQVLDLPGYRLHPLKGDLKGFLAVTVRANWRIIFRFEGGHAYDVDLTDYH